MYLPGTAVDVQSYRRLKTRLETPSCYLSTSTTLFELQGVRFLLRIAHIVGEMIVFHLHTNGQV